MHTLTIHINNDSLLEKVSWFLEHLKGDGLEVVTNEDAEDLKLLEATRGEETISFEDFLKNEG